MWMIRPIFKLPNSAFLCHQLDLLRIQLRPVLISFAVQILHTDGVDINIGKPIFLPLVAGGDGEIVEGWVRDLLLTASGVCNIAVRFLGPNIDVVHEDADSNSTSLILVQVEVAAVPARHEAIEVSGVGHARESFVLDGDYSLKRKL